MDSALAARDIRQIAYNHNGNNYIISYAFEGKFFELEIASEYAGCHSSYSYDAEDNVLSVKIAGTPSYEYDLQRYGLSNALQNLATKYKADSLEVYSAAVSKPLNQIKLGIHGSFADMMEAIVSASKVTAR